MGWKNFGLHSSHRGTILLETLLAVVILFSAALVIFPVYKGWQEEKKLEMATAEIVAAIRQVVILSKNDLPDLAEGMTFVCEKAGDGTWRYYAQKGTERFEPKGNLPKGIRVDGGNVSIRFRKDNGTAGGEERKILLITADQKYKRMVTVAVYTGRARIEKVK